MYSSLYHLAVVIRFVAKLMYMILFGIFRDSHIRQSSEQNAHVIENMHAFFFQHLKPHHRRITRSQLHQHCQ